MLAHSIYNAGGLFTLIARCRTPRQRTDRFWKSRTACWCTQNTEEVLDCLRGCNVAARWLMLHATARHPRLGPAVAERLPPPAAVVAFVMDTALLEFEVRFGCAVLLRWLLPTLEQLRQESSCRDKAIAVQHSTANPG